MAKEWYHKEEVKELIRKYIKEDRLARGGMATLKRKARNARSPGERRKYKLKMRVKKALGPEKRT